MRLVLVAASGLALEAIAALRTFGYVEDAVVLDDDPDRWSTELGDVPVVGGLAEIRHRAEHRVLVCAGRGTARQSIVERLTGLLTRAIEALPDPDACGCGTWWDGVDLTYEVPGR